MRPFVCKKNNILNGQASPSRSVDLMIGRYYDDYSSIVMLHICMQGLQPPNQKNGDGKNEKEKRREERKTKKTKKTDLS